MNHRLLIVWLFIGFLLLYCLATFYPDSFLWGVNHLAFLDPVGRVLIILISLLIGIFFYRSKNQFEFFDSWLSIKKKKFIIALAIIGLFASIIFYFFRINTDMYGDARTLLSLLAGQPYSFFDIFTFRETEPLTRYIHQQLSLIFNLDQKLVYQVVSSVSGGLYLMLLLVFVRNIKVPAMWKFLIVIMGMASGVCQLFFGYVEDYTLVFVAMTLFMILAWFLFDGEKLLWQIVVVFFVGIRLHIEMILLLPALVYLIFFYLSKDNIRIRQWLQPSRLIAVVITTMIISTLMYFFFFHADRYLIGDQKEIMAKIFLPIHNPLSPPHSYSLLTLNHFSDFFQLLFLVAAPPVVLLFCIIIFYRHNISWKEPRIIFYTLALIYLLIFEFTVNPMLTMPRDWDLLSASAAPILFLSIAVSKQLIDTVSVKFDVKYLVGITVMVSVLSSTIFYINWNEEKAGLRLEGVGKWAFKSYYQGAVYMINVGERLINDIPKQIEHREKTIKDLLLYATKPDENISLLYYKLANEYYYIHEFDNASLNLSNALNYDRGNASAVKGLGLIALQTKNFEQASEIFSFYNTNVNRPIINDSLGLQLAEITEQLKMLAEKNKDTALIQMKLDEIFPLMK